MPWKENCTLEERMTLMCDYLDGAVTMAELCRRCGISRKTGYKWLERNRVDGRLGLQARSRAPHGRPRAMIVALARKLLIALWRLVTTGEVPEGFILRPAL